MTTADALAAQATESTGLEDFGSKEFREGLEVYCESAFSEAQLNELGTAAVSGNIVSSLANRLRVVDWAGRHPEVVAERIEAPLIVIGIFRAGTTYFSYLLDQDPRNRPLLSWESTDSTPPPTPEQFRSGPRVEAARARMKMLETLNPKSAIVYHEEADGPTECISVMSQDFKSLSWEAISNVPSYSRWLLEVDQRSAYVYHRLVLQVLQHGGVRGRWTLKSPHHAIALESLRSVYPDARLVVIHRDPVALCGSVCSLIQTLSSTFSDVDHTRYIAEHWTAMLETSIKRMEAFRAAHPDHPVVDVQYDDLVADPVGTVARVYEGFGDDLSQAARANMADYVSNRDQHRAGAHSYDPIEFGLDPRELAERFAGYTDRYVVPTSTR
jgi:Sulfotransferase family